ncbi:unnamed protein product [Allacma fusca]|uniref:Uncharacterized protein n=1 Tax=Allacma fusca TaxID=39272 RepID=A0A8J2JUR7_9HEXA|nr:unnamed protein product [Allacma fusca]
MSTFILSLQTYVISLIQLESFPAGRLDSVTSIICLGSGMNFHIYCNTIGKKFGLPDANHIKIYICAQGCVCTGFLQTDSSGTANQSLFRLTSPHLL